MSWTVLIEGLLLLFVGILGGIEGLRLTIYKDPYTLYDLLGPGLYLLVFSVALMVTAVIYLFTGYRKTFDLEKEFVSRELKARMIKIVVVLVLYTFLINIFGYLVASLAFFFLEFRIVGVKSWLLDALLTLVTTIIFYLVFIHYCNMVFPRGIFLS